jgi:hypothetical protein
MGDWNLPPHVVLDHGIRKLESGRGIAEGGNILFRITEWIMVKFALTIKLKMDIYLLKTNIPIFHHSIFP